MKKEYRITGRMRKDEKRHVIDSSKKWTLQNAQKRLREIELEEKYKRGSKKANVVKSGLVSVSTEYHSDYDLLELKIECREVTPWEIV